MATRKRFRRRRFTTKHLSIAKKALRKVNKIARRFKPEQKIHDIGNTVIIPTIAGTVTNLVAISSGATEITRVGLVIRPFFFEFRYQALKHATPTNTNIRIVICRDNRQVDSTAPSYLDVMNAAVPNSPYSRVNPKRFTILYNHFFVLRTNRIALVKTVTRKMHGTIGYLGPGVGDITRDGIFLLTEADAGAGVEPAIRFTWRMRFTDV